MALTPPIFTPPPPSLVSRREGIRISRRESSITPLDKIIFRAYPLIRLLAPPYPRRFRLETPLEEEAYITSSYNFNNNNNVPFKDTGLRI